MIEIDELFFSVMSCRRYHSQMFLKIDVLRNFASFTRKHLCWSLFLIKLQAKFLRTRSFTEHLQWLLLWFLQQNYLIFSVITITLRYKQKLSWKYRNYYHPPYIKKSISYQKYAHLVQKFCSLSHRSPNFLILSSIYFCIISIFLRGSGVSHSYTVSLINVHTVSAASEMFLKLFPGYQNSSKIHNVNKN